MHPKLWKHVSSTTNWSLAWDPRRNICLALKELASRAAEGALEAAAARHLLWAVPATEAQLSGAPGVPPEGFSHWRVHPKVSTPATAAGPRHAMNDSLRSMPVPTNQSMPWSTQTPRLQGQGIFAKRSLPRHTFVGEYLGELYAPWRWFEKQDLLRKRNPAQSLPDFYNICLERPPEVQGGRDVVFVEVRRCLHLASLAGLFVKGSAVCTREMHLSVWRKSALLLERLHPVL